MVILNFAYASINKEYKRLKSKRTVKSMKNYNRLFLLNLIALFFLSTSSLAINSISSLKLEKGNFRILLSGHEVEPVKLAAETLSKDFEKVMHTNL